MDSLPTNRAHPEVRVVDLEVIKRFSLAVRCEWAPADEVLAALEASRDAVLAAMEAAPTDPEAAARRRPLKASSRRL